jgi:DNA polymerase iota
MLVNEGLQLCPQLVLVQGEDLHDYRQMSAKITSLLHRYSPLVEKLGLDENFVDVTNLVAERLKNSTDQQNVDGYVYSDLNEKCECGCKDRLCIGSHIASEMRSEIHNVLGITSCAGISYNKLLAKLVCATHKPNQQTTVFPCNTLMLVTGLQNLRGIPGIGHRMYETLQFHGISCITDLQNCNLTSLQKVVGNDMAIRMKKLSFGIDESPVKQTGKPQSIGLEDGFRKICSESDVKDKLATLLERLLRLLSEDGRIPGSVRVTVRKYDSIQKQSHRESRQCNVAATHFIMNGIAPERSEILPKSNEKFMALIMQLFHKMVDVSKPFHLTLLGLAFTKFQECKIGKGSIASFLTNDISIQSVPSFESASETEKMEYPCMNSTQCLERSDSESEPKPESKRSRTEPIPRSGKRFSNEEDSICVEQVSGGPAGDSADCALWMVTGSESPNEQTLNTQKIPVEHSSNSVVTRKMSRESQTNSGRSSIMTNDNEFQWPHNVDADVFHALPHELKMELIEAWRMGTNVSSASQSTQVPVHSRPKQKSILHYFLPKQ